MLKKNRSWRPRYGHCRTKWKTWIRSLPVRAIVFAAIRKATILTTASVVHQRGEVMMDNEHRRSGFWPGLAVAMPQSHRPGGFLSLFWPRTSVTIPRTQSVKPWYGHWRPSLKYLFKKPGLTDWGMATDVLVENNFFKKNEKSLICETVVWPLADQVKYLI